MDITFNSKQITLLLLILTFTTGSNFTLPTRHVVQSSNPGPDPFSNHDDDVASLYAQEERHYTFKMIERVAELPKKHEVVHTHTLQWALNWLRKPFRNILGDGGIGEYQQVNQVTYFMGTVYFGGNFEGFPVIWDTGSEWPVIMSMRCLSCPPPMARYNFFDEIGITFYQRPNSCGVRNYGSARIEGCEARDWVCVAPQDDACARNMQIFVGTRQQGLPQEISGIIGLATDADRFIGPNVIKILRNSGAIDDIVFAFYLRSHLDTGSSFIDIG